MRALLQRVLRAEVRVEGAAVGRIDHGLLALVGAGRGDGDDDVRWLAEKVVHLRIFADDAGQMNRSLLDVGGALLAVSQFTLYGDCRRGRRPSFVEALSPDAARELFDRFVAAARDHGVAVETGRFRSHMEVELVNDGPVTLLVDSRQSP